MRSVYVDVTGSLLMSTLAAFTICSGIVDMTDLEEISHAQDGCGIALNLGLCLDIINEYTPPTLPDPTSTVDPIDRE